MIEANNCKLFFSQKGVAIETQPWVGKQNNTLFSSDVISSHFARGKNDMLLLEKKKKKELADLIRVNCKRSNAGKLMQKPAG